MSSAAGTGRGAWERLRSLPGRTPLRVKLIAAVLALVAIALAVISITGISLLRSYLMKQYDNTLQGYVGGAERIVGQYLGGAPPQPGGVAVAWVPSGGKLQWVIQPAQPGSFNPFSSQPQLLPDPQIPANSAWLAANSNHDVTVPAQSGGRHWRIYLDAVSSPGNDSITGIVIVGV